MKDNTRRLVLAVAMVAMGLTALTARPASAANDLSLGLVLGDPSGITLRGGIGGPSAIQAALGFGFFPGDAVTLTVDWTYDAWDFLRGNSTAAMYLYFGVGAKGMWFTGRHFAYVRDDKKSFDDHSHFGIGARALAGIRVAFRNAPFDLFFELAPLSLVVVVPDPGIYYDADGAIGFRYRF